MLHVSHGSFRVPSTSLYITFEVGRVKYKSLENCTFVGDGRFIIENGKASVESRWFRLHRVIDVVRAWKAIRRWNCWLWLGMKWGEVVNKEDMQQRICLLLSSQVISYPILLQTYNLFWCQHFTRLCIHPRPRTQPQAVPHERPSLGKHAEQLMHCFDAADWLIK